MANTRYVSLAISVLLTYSIGLVFAAPQAWEDVSNRDHDDDAFWLQYYQPAQSYCKNNWHHKGPMDTITDTVVDVHTDFVTDYHLTNVVTYENQSFCRVDLD